MQQNVNKLLNLEYLIKLKKPGDEQVKIAFKNCTLLYDNWAGEKLWQEKAISEGKPDIIFINQAKRNLFCFLL